MLSVPAGDFFLCQDRLDGSNAADAQGAPSCLAPLRRRGNLPSTHGAARQGLRELVRSAFASGTFDQCARVRIGVCVRKGRVTSRMTLAL